MVEFSAFDSAQMARALQLAARGRYTAHPNPMVGCVLVRDGGVVGEGWHVQTGGPHAEIVAIEDAGDASGATAYVTLEPCSHHGRTPPCADALFLARVAEVVCAMPDPYPAVNSSGLRALETAGLRVRVGLMRAQAEALNRGFLSRVTTGRPFVRVKIAASLDGATAMANGESQWITGPAARRDVQRLRAESGAVLTGAGTVAADDPSLNVRRDYEHEIIDTGGRQPLRVVVDSRLRMLPSALMLGLPGDTIVYCTDDTQRAPLEQGGAEVVKLAAADATGRVDLAAVLDDLGRREINSLLVEAGPTLAGSIVDAGFADELVIYQAPHIMGSETRAMLDTPSWTTLGERRGLEITDLRQVGADTRIVARFQKGR